MRRSIVTLTVLAVVAATPAIPHAQAGFLGGLADKYSRLSLLSQDPNFSKINSVVKNATAFQALIEQYASRPSLNKPTREQFYSALQVRRLVQIAKSAPPPPAVKLGQTFKGADITPTNSGLGGILSSVIAKSAKSGAATAVPGVGELYDAYTLGETGGRLFAEIDPEDARELIAYIDIHLPSLNQPGLLLDSPDITSITTFYTIQQCQDRPGCSGSAVSILHMGSDSQSGGDTDDPGDTSPASAAAGAPNPDDPNQDENSSASSKFDKVKKQLTSRGWTQDSATDTVSNPYTTRISSNSATGEPATAYYNQDGSYVVTDNQSGNVLQVSKRGDPNWIPDKRIQNPYVPGKP